MAAEEVKVPDIGDFKSVEVIEVLVKPGDTIVKEQSLITLESDKATMEIPSPADGVVKEIKLKVGDKISKGAPILVMASGDAGAAPARNEEPSRPAPRPSAVEAAAPSSAAPAVAP